MPEAVALAQELEMLTEAIQSLPERCREAFISRRLYRLSQREVAALLGTFRKHGRCPMHHRPAQIGAFLPPSRPAGRVGH